MRIAKPERSDSDTGSRFGLHRMTMRPIASSMTRGTMRFPKPLPECASPLPTPRREPWIGLRGCPRLPCRLEHEECNSSATACTGSRQQDGCHIRRRSSRRQRTMESSESGARQQWTGYRVTDERSSACRGSYVLMLIAFLECRGSIP
jgi:hypothetical protein